MSTKKTAFTTIALAAAGAFTVGGVALANAGAVTNATGALTSYTQATTAPGQQNQQGPADQQGPMGQMDGRGPGGHAHTDASAAETTQVKDAVRAKDSSVTVERVVKDADGSFDAMGTKSGQRVMVEVSKDLKTVEVRTGGPGHGPRGGMDGQAPQGTPGQSQQGPANGTGGQAPSASGTSASA